MPTESPIIETEYCVSCKNIILCKHIILLFQTVDILYEKRRETAYQAFAEKKT